MPVIHAPETAFAQEMKKWEAHHTQYGPPGRPYPYKPGDAGYEFPRLLYKAVRKLDGTRVLENFRVKNDTEQQNMLSRGFSLTQEAALEVLDREHTEHGKLAAEINYQVRRMSEGARSEAEAAQEAAGARHLPMIPATKKRGRKPKAEAVKEQS